MTTPRTIAAALAALESARLAVLAIDLRGLDLLLIEDLCHATDSVRAVLPVCED